MSVGYITRPGTAIVQTADVSPISDREKLIKFYTPTLLQQVNTNIFGIIIRLLVFLKAYRCSERHVLSCNRAPV